MVWIGRIWNWIESMERKICNCIVHLPYTLIDTKNALGMSFIFLSAKGMYTGNWIVCVCVCVRVSIEYRGE